ncbi:MAG: hypothetical protein CM15mP77_0090 [Synechococcus sp.]|nr:MAG: hypothetical protein CM15mP77_0090 [Synechococcus sp.]
MGVNAGVEQHQIRLLLIQHLREVCPRWRRVIVIACCILEGNINVTLHFAQREIAGGMHGQGDARLIGEASRFVPSP